MRDGGKGACAAPTLTQTLFSSQRLAETHGDECASIRSTEARRLAEMRRRWAEEIEAGERGAQAGIEMVDKEGAMKREQWEGKMKNKVVKESVAMLEKERDDLKKKRDAEIEKAIRRTQTATVGMSRGAKERLKEMEKTMKQDYDKRMKGILDKKNRWVEKIAENVDLVRDLQDQKSRHTQTLIALDEYSKQMDEGIEGALRQREEEKGRLVDEEERVGEAKSRELKLLMVERAAVEKDIKAKRKEVESSMEVHRGNVESCKEEHEKDLESLERRVKFEVGQKEARIREIQEVVEGQAVRCDHAKKMIENYKRRRAAEGR